MNQHERKMYDSLRRLHTEFGAVAVKAEFEAEGTRREELYRLLDLGRRAGLKVGLKVGGCEAITDMMTCRQLGADYIIAPMVETEYAALKYIEAKNKVYPSDERPDTKFLFNLETMTGYDNREALVKAALVKNGADGIVFGRVDFSMSAGWGRDAIGSENVTACVEGVAALCRQHNLELVVGGGVAVETVAALQRIAETYLTRFETRKVIFEKTALDGDIKRGLSLAVQFELLWLKSKRDYYSSIATEDDKRLTMLEARWKVLSAEMNLA